MSDYDYLIVGAGSSGATLAARLTEDAATRVLLLEAGPDWRSADAPPELRSPNPGHAADAGAVSTRTSGPRCTPNTPRAARRNATGAGAASAAVRRSMARSPFAACWKIMTSGPSRAAPAGQAKRRLPYFNKLEDDLDFGDAPYHGRGGPIPIYRAPLETWGRSTKPCARRRWRSAMAGIPTTTPPLAPASRPTRSTVAISSASPPTTPTWSRRANVPT